MPTGFSSCSREWGKLLFQINFLHVGSHFFGASIHEKTFQIGATVLALKLDKWRMLGGGGATIPIEQKLTYFSDHEDDIQS